MDKILELFSKNKQKMYTYTEVSDIVGLSADTCKRTLNRLVASGKIDKFKFGANVKYAAKLGKGGVHPSVVAKGQAVADKWEAQGIEFDDTVFHVEATQYGIKLDSKEAVVKELALLRKEHSEKNLSLWNEATADALYEYVQGKTNE